MGGEWKLKKVSDVADVVAGGTPSTKNADYYGGDISWITPKDLSNHKDRYIKYGERSITQAGLEKSSAKLLPKDTILFTSRAPIGYVAIADQEVSTNQGFKNLVLKRGNDPEFFYYLLKHNVPLFERMASGSTFKEVSGQVVKDTELSVPGYSTQKKVAKILGSLDNKIELNRQTNETLEKIAQALFKSWFVDFDPVIDNALAAGNTIPDELQDRAERRQQQLAKPDHQPLPDAIRQLFPNEFELTEALGWVPMGWEVGITDNIATTNASSWTKKSAPPQVEYVDLANAKNGHIQDTTSYQFGDAPSRAKRKLSKGDTIIGLVRPGNRSFAYIHQNGLTGSTGFAVMKPRSEGFRAYLYFHLTRKDVIDEFARLADGAAYPAIRPEVVSNFVCLLPSDSVLSLYQDIVNGFLEKIAVSSLENKQLENTRDTLLPKLISGELRLPSDASADAEQPGTACAASS